MKKTKRGGINDDQPPSDLLGESQSNYFLIGDNAQRTEVEVEWTLDQHEQTMHDYRAVLIEANTARDRIAELEQELAAAREALRTYGRHAASCWKTIRYSGDHTAPDSCSCGFDVASTAALQSEGV